MSDPGFMIPLNQRDFEFPFDNGARNICDSANQATYTHAPWYTCENIQLTSGGTTTSNPTVGTPYVIQVGIEALPAQNGTSTPSVVQNIQAWVCYPNSVPGSASATLVVPSMQNNQFAYFSNPMTPALFGGDNPYQDPAHGFSWFDLSPWTPTQEDFLEQFESPAFGGHCCVVANAAGQASVEDLENPTESGEPVGVVITDNSQLSTDFDICHSLYQGQRNIVILPASQSGRIGTGLVFLSGAPEQTVRLRTTIAVTAIDQGGQVDPVLLKALSSAPYAGLPLKPASSPPKSLRLARHEHKSHSRLTKIVHEAEEIVEELLGLEKHPFGGGHQLHLSLPPQGLQPLRMAVELDPSEPPGTVHAVEITQTDANGARGGIRAGVVVTP